MNILFNRRTKLVTGLNRPARPFEIELEVQGLPNLSKEIEEVHGQVHKTNEEGLPLYLDGEQEVTYATKVIEEVTQEVIKEEDVNGDGVLEKVTYTEVIQPSKEVELPPVMVDNVVKRIVSFEEEPQHFTYDEVKNAPVKLTPIDKLRQENLGLKLAIAELGSSEDTRIKELQLAVAELGIMISSMGTGGTN